MSSSYFPLLSNLENAPAFRDALLAIGCSSNEAAIFSNRKYSALPKWLRLKIKAATRKHQAEPRKLCPAGGALAFYINSSRFPRMKKPLPQQPKHVFVKTVASINATDSRPTVKHQKPAATVGAVPQKPGVKRKRKWYLRRNRREAAPAHTTLQAVAA